MATATTGSVAPDRQAARERLDQVFRFLRELAAQRYPVPRNLREQVDWLSLAELPEVPVIQKGGPNDDQVLRVARPKLTPAPQPPDALRGWLQPGWDDPSKDVAVMAQRSVPVYGVPVLQQFEQSPERTEALPVWRRLRQTWADSERPVRKALAVFEWLYALHSRLQREGELLEVMLGRGVLHVAEAEIEHPVLLQRLDLGFDPFKPEFSLTETDRPLELYTALLRTVRGVEGGQLSGLQKELEEGSATVLDDTARAYMKGLVHRLFARGRFLEDGEPPPTDQPAVRDGQFVLVRRRGQVAVEAMDRVLEDLRGRDGVTAALSRIVGVFGPASAPEGGAGGGEGAGSVPPPAAEVDLLLSKPSNQQQREIAQQLERHGCVQVQGPPGTGKSHTIANLLGHLLAQGKSVLVTAHTNKALRVLHGHVVSELQPLCVSALEGDLVARADLERAIGGIVSRLSGADPEARRELEEAARLTAGRAQALTRLAELRTALREARSDETRSIVVAGHAEKPCEAAKIVAEGRGVNDWIPGPVTPGAALPLEPQDVTWLYESSLLISPEQEKEIEDLTVASKQLPSPTDFSRAAAELKTLLGADVKLAEELWAVPPTAGDAGRLRQLAAQVETTTGPLRTTVAWELSVLDAGREEAQGPREAWEGLVRQIETLYKLAARLQPVIAKLGPALPVDEALNRLEEVYKALADHVSSGGGLGAIALLLKPEWKRVLGKSQVGRQAPRTTEHFRALADLAHLEAMRSETRARWDRQMAHLGAPESRTFGRTPEQSMHAVGEKIQHLLDWHRTTWAALQTQCKALGVNWEEAVRRGKATDPSRPFLSRLLDTGEAVLQPAIQQRLVQIRKTQLKEWLGDVDGRLSSVETGRTPAKVVSDLRAAVQGLASEGYAAAFARLVELETLLGLLQRRRELLDRLEKGAKSWAAAIRRRGPGHHNGAPPGNPEAAWLWIQYSEELDRRHRKDLLSMERQIDALEDEVQRLTSSLVDRRAWASQIRSTQPEARQALIGWLDTVKRIGKGTGIRAPKLRREAMRLMQKAKGAVPVWIMPLSRAMESFDPTKDRFDVVIIDEASQADASALFALYLGKSVIVVGDDEQVSPEAVGQELAHVEALIQEHLKGIPNSHLYDGKMSVYDLAKASFGGVIRLTEHFRCVPDIIEFSNHLSYHGTIRPLREPSAVVQRPSTVAYRVDGASADGKVNRKEAETVASLVAAVVAQPEYAGASIGVISMVGEEQAREIETLLRGRLREADYNERRILCGNPAQFQGDERDVVFLSVVDTAAPGQMLPIRQDDRFKKRFNVAASRARNQMWVVHSLDLAGNLRAGDLRRRLIEHAQDPHSLAAKVEKAARKAESDFERRVLADLVSRGYHVHPQWPVGPFRIDIVAECKGQRAAIECDGDRYHGAEALAADLEREAILRRLGWRFVRIRGSQYYGDPEGTMAKVVRALEELEVAPWTPSGSEPVQGAEQLREAVVRAADRIREEWKKLADERPAPEVRIPGPRPFRKKATASASTESANTSASDSPSPTPEPRRDQETTEVPAPTTPPSGGEKLDGLLANAEVVARRNGTLTPLQLRQLMDVDELLARRLLSQLEELGIVRKLGSGRNTYYLYVKGA